MDTNIIPFQEALNKTNPESRYLLLGNGFSQAFSDEFSYESLLDKSGITPRENIYKIFDALNTKDFEEVIAALESAEKIASIYKTTHKEVYNTHAKHVKKALLKAVANIHVSIKPASFGKEKRISCAIFLDDFKEIFTLNYDLLLYWVRLQKDIADNYKDGFGLGSKTNNFRCFNPQAHCNIYNLHGGLHLFSDSEGNIKKRITKNGDFLNSILQAIEHESHRPLIVTEGSSNKKLEKINSNSYLRFCLDRLSSRCGSIFIFGHSANDNDSHIFETIFAEKSNIKEVFFFLRNPTKDTLKIKRKRLEKYRLNNENIELLYIDAADANIWGDS